MGYTCFIKFTAAVTFIFRGFERVFLFAFSQAIIPAGILDGGRVVVDVDEGRVEVEDVDEANEGRVDVEDVDDSNEGRVDVEDVDDSNEGWVDVEDVDEEEAVGFNILSTTGNKIIA